MNLISLHHDIFFLADSGRIEMTLQSNIYNDVEIVVCVSGECYCCQRKEQEAGAWAVESVSRS